MPPPASRPSPPSAAPALEGGGVESLALGSAPEVPARPDDRRLPLRLTASRGTLGLELYRPVELGPLTVSRLTLTLPGLKFPVDLSGGVPRFRHRRGELEELVLELELTALARWSSRFVAELLGRASRPPTLWPIAGGIGVGLLGPGRALAFDLLWAPDRGDARFVVANARGAGLELPALGLALRVLDSVLGELGVRRGRSVRITAVGRRLGRVLLPAVGARAPAADAARFGELEVGPERLRVELDAHAPPPVLGLEASRALELAALVADADDALGQGDPDAARGGYVTALEQAPRHPELVRMVAEIDAKVNGRAEAALGLLVESLPATRAGLVGAELLAKVGDRDGAREAVREVAEHEPFAPLAALSWLRLAELDVDAPERALALDRAVARAPGLAETRWARFVARVERGDIAGALADAEHLEAIESGARARHEACLRTARALLAAGHVEAAGKLFERALRYAPDDAAASAGLARAFLLAGRPERALLLLERAVELGERGGRIDAEALIDLGRTLAERLRDLPQAIVRVRQVPAASERAIEARYLEGVYRSKLGDRVGATLAFGRLREAVELSGVRQPAWANWLIDAADNALLVEGDAVAAERHLAVALWLKPNDDELGRRYREVAARVADRR